MDLMEYIPLISQIETFDEVTLMHTFMEEYCNTGLFPGAQSILYICHPIIAI